MSGTNLGRALISIGDDVARFAATERAVRAEQMRDARLLEIEKMRDAREREIAELARKVQLEEEKIRAAAGIGIVGHNLSDEHLAAAAGMTVPEYRSVVQYLRTGERPPVATGEGDAGNVPTTGASSDSDFADKVRRVQQAILFPIVGPQGVDKLQKTSKDYSLFANAISPDPARRELARQAARAMRGENRYRSEGGQNIDEHSGFMGPTEKSAAETEAFNALRRLRDAQAQAARANQNQRRSGDGGLRDLDDRTLQQALETQRKVVNDLNKDFSRSAKERRQREIERLNQLQAEQDRRLGLRTADQAPTPMPSPTPAPASAPTARTPAAPYKEGQYLFGPQGDMYIVRGGVPVKLKDGERITGRDGKTYVIRNGRPVPL